MSMTTTKTRSTLTAQPTPYDVLATMHKSYFHKLLGAGPKAFWEKVSPDDPRLIDHPMLKVPGWMDRAIPITVWGDSARYTSRDKSIHALVWTIMLTELAWGWKAIFPILFWPKVACAKHRVHGVDTMEELWKHARHSLNALFRGKHLDVDADDMPWIHPRQQELAGKPLADGE